MSSIYECWQSLFSGIYWLVINYWWIPAIWATVYTIGAGIFLLTLRIQSEDGTLVVNRDSLAYLIAHPMYRHQQFNLEDHWEDISPEQGSICTFFARLFHMLFLIWPFILLYLFAIATLGSVLGLVFVGQLAIPDLRYDGFFRGKNINVGSRRLLPLIFFIVPLLILFLIIFKFKALMHGFSGVLYVLLCASPALIVIALLVIALIWIGTSSEQTSNVFIIKEFVIAKKRKLCKFVEYR